MTESNISKDRQIKFIILAILFLVISVSSEAFAKSGLHIDINSDTTEVSGGLSSKIIQIIGLLTILSLAPSIVMMVTSFTRIVVVFSILRNGLGLQQTPPNMVMSSLAIFLTIFIMQPHLEKAYDEGIKPLIENKISEEVAWEKSTKPFHNFMVKNTREKELSLFLDMSNSRKIDKTEDIPFMALVPAFMISELKKAFQIGFLLFLPFMIIDILVAAVLMAMGMMMMPPAMLALPIKIIFFVMVDGWYLICGSLVKSYIL